MKNTRDPFPQTSTDQFRLVRWVNEQDNAQVLSFLPTLRDANLFAGTETHDDAGAYKLTPEIALIQMLNYFLRWWTTRWRAHGVGYGVLLRRANQRRVAHGGAGRTDELVRRLLTNGTLRAVVIGEVVPKRDKALWVK